MIDFATRSREATKKFLRTIVIVDDFPANEESDDSTTLDGPVPALYLPDDVELDETPSVDQTPSVDETLESVNSEHRLNSLDLQLHFARAGLLLTVISAKSSSEAEGPIQLIRDRADVLILDWMWLGDKVPGDFCISQIKSLSETDQEQLVIIYTGNSDPEPIKRRIETVGLGEIDSTSMRYTNNRGLQVAVLQKEWANGSFFESSKVSEDALPENVLNLFAEYAGGLLANGAMVALGSVRTSTHSILHRFRSELDPAYMVHRAEVDPTMAAETHVVDLIADSISDVVMLSEGIDEVGEGAIRSWLSLKGPSVLPELQHRHLISGGLWESGEGKPKRITASKNKPVEMGKLTALLAGKPTEAGDILQREFSEFMYVLNSPPFFLTSGVIVSKGDEFYACVMPACDLERVSGDISVPFLKVHYGVGKLNDFGFVMRANGEVRVFHIKTTFEHVTMLAIHAGQTVGRVEAVVDRNRSYFEGGTGSQRVRYGFVTRLRPTLAQALTVGLGSSVSRIGTTENEYDRLQRKHQK